MELSTYLCIGSYILLRVIWYVFMLVDIYIYIYVRQIVSCRCGEGVEHGYKKKKRKKKETNSTLLPLRERDVAIFYMCLPRLTACLTGPSLPSPIYTAAVGASSGIPGMDESEVLSKIHLEQKKSPFPPLLPSSSPPPHKPSLQPPDDNL